MKRFLFLLLLLPGMANAADGVNTQLVVRVTGLFSPARVDELRAAVATIPNLSLENVDLGTAAATFRGSTREDPFKHAKPEQVVQRIDQLLKNVSNHTLGCTAPGTTPPGQLERIEIMVKGLDCKGCAFGAYRTLTRVEGVVQATVSFKEGRANVLFDSKRTGRAALGEALKKAGVGLPE